MARYTLGKEFQQIKETAGTIVNISDVKAEVSEQAQANTGIIIYPRQALAFQTRLYAARAPSDVGTAVIGVLTGTEPAPSGDDPNPNPNPDEDGGDEEVTDEDIENIFGNPNLYEDDGDEEIADEDIKNLFGN